MQIIINFKFIQLWHSITFVTKYYSVWVGPEAYIVNLIKIQYKIYADFD